MKNQNDLQVVDGSKQETALYLLTKAEIDTQISTAKAFPRSLTAFQKKAESMVSLSEDIAASCSYALPRGGKHLEGPSIRLAEIVAASYGNVQYGGRIISNDGQMIVAQGVCIDLENNVKATVEVSRKITDSKGKTYSQDMQVVTGNAAIAIAVRNAILKVIPGALIQGIYDKSKEVARGTAETLKTRRQKALEYFKGLGVTEKQICDTLGVKGIEDIDLDKLYTLTGMRSAIKNGESTVKELFEQEAIKLEDLQLLYDMKKESLKGEDQVHAERILKNKEESSYAKLHQMLQAA